MVERLLDAAKSLPDGIKLSEKETYRPKEFQEYIYYRRAKRLASLPENIGKTDSEILEETAQFIAPPEVSGHPTGGAVDVTLVDENFRELDLGCGYDEDEQASNGRWFSFSKDISALAIENRKLLFDCMGKSGFVNYPYEWWHWSFGDKYWAAVLDEPYAIFEAVSRGYQSRGNDA